MALKDNQTRPPPGGPRMTAHARTTVELLRAVRSGPDDPAWRLFTERYEPLLLAVSRGFGLRPDDAQDVSQQALLEFVRDLRAGAFDRERGRMRHWILAILRNRLRDHLRARARRAAAPMDALSEAAAIPDPGSLDRELDGAWQRELERRIAVEAFDRLRAAGSFAPATLQAFELAALRGVPAASAAELCGITVDQVYVARSRVAARLRELVAEVEREWSEEDAWAP